jgi:hypothetical protein
VGFLKNQQVKMAIRLLAWQYEKNGQPLPERSIWNDTPGNWWMMPTASPG